jgi:diguanylate cyclase (GGDEF)-like protein
MRPTTTSRRAATRLHMIGAPRRESARLVGETIRANVRPYDLIVRYGGDELICAMPNLSGHEATARFKKIAAELSAVSPDHSIAFGLAAAEPAEGLQELLVRADTDLLEARRVDKSSG